jgi:hypothetical protein
VVKSALLLFLLPACAFAKSPPIDYHEPPPDPPGAGAIPNAPPILDHMTRPGAFQQLPALDENRWVFLPPVKTPYWSFGKLDPVLTEACRLGDFATAPLNRILLQFAGDRGRALFQVVPPLYRHLLFDRRKLARPGVTYYFFDTAQPSCEVRVDANVALNAFPPGRGSALPPFDPRALAKKKAEIKSWPK